MSPERDDSTEVTPTVTLARIYEGQDHLHKAADVYKKLIALDPDSVELKKALRDVERRLESQVAVPQTPEDKSVLHQLERLQETVRSRKRALEKRREEERKILVIHGPKADIIGMAEPSLSSDLTLEEIDLEVKKTAGSCGMTVDTFQSDDEEDLVRKIRGASEGYNALIINPGEYAVTSLPIREAISTLDFPVIEVHLSNIHAKKPSSQKSLLTEVVTAYIAGFGKEGYNMAVRAAVDIDSW
jgi:3-dehydroquinate dehydratase-2